MACPTCGHTLATLCVKGERGYSHCERCGTVVMWSGDRQADEVYRPKLVDRCRQFQLKLGPMLGQKWPTLREHWQWLGIAESINLPEARVVS